MLTSIFLYVVLSHVNPTYHISLPHCDFTFYCHNAKHCAVGMYFIIKMHFGKCTSSLLCKSHHIILEMPHHIIALYYQMTTS